MWWKLGGLALLAVGLIALLLTPIPTIDVTVNLPAARGLPTASTEDAIIIGAAFGAFAVILAVLGIIGWLMWRVVRHHRAQRDQL